MERIREVLAAQERYWRCYGGPSEEDHSLNDMNRDLIEAMNGHYGQVYVGSINGDLVLAQYNGEKIYNFAYDFCVPQYDAELETLLRQWKGKHMANGIIGRVSALHDIKCARKSTPSGARGLYEYCL